MGLSGHLVRQSVSFLMVSCWHQEHNWVHFAGLKHIARVDLNWAPLGHHHRRLLSLDQQIGSFVTIIIECYWQFELLQHYLDSEELDLVIASNRLAYTNWAHLEGAKLASLDRQFQRQDKPYSKESYFDNTDKLNCFCFHLSKHRPHIVHDKFQV